MVKQTSTAQQTSVPAAGPGAAAEGEFVITDMKGRKLRMRPPSILAQFRLVEALGESAKNQIYMSMVIPLLFIATIDDQPVRVPTSKVEVEHLIERLGEAGIAAMMQGMLQHFMPRPADMSSLSPAAQPEAQAMA